MDTLLVAISENTNQIQTLDMRMVFLSLGVTSAVVFFTISLIPFQQLAVNYSPHLIEYLRKHIGLQAGYALLLLSILALALLPFLRLSMFLNWVSLLLFLIILLDIIVLWYLSTKLLNIANYVIPAIAKQLQKEIKRGLKDAKRIKNDPIKRIEELESMAHQAILDGRKIPVDAPFIILESVYQNAYPLIRRMFDLALTFLRQGHNDMYGTVIAHIRNSIFQYLYQRREFYSAIDNIIVLISEETASLVQAANSVKNSVAKRQLWVMIREISQYSLIVKKVGVEGNSHDLARPILSLLARELKSDSHTLDRASVYAGIRDYGSVADTYSRNSFPHSATEIVEHIAEIALISKKANFSELKYICHKYIADIFLRLVFFTRSGNSYNQFGRVFIKIYDRILDGNTDTPALGVTDFILWYDVNPMNDSSISSIYQASLFPNMLESDSEYDRIVSSNIEIAADLVGILGKHYFNSTTTQSSYGLQLYQCGLRSLAFLYPKETTQIIPEMNVMQMPSESNIEEVSKILSTIRKNMGRILIKYLSREESHYNDDDLLHYLLSLFYLDLHFAQKYTKNRIEMILMDSMDLFQILHPKIKKIELNEFNRAMIHQVLGYLGTIERFKPIKEILEKRLKAGERLTRIKRIRSARMAKDRGFPPSLAGSGLRYDQQFKLRKIARPPFAHYPDVFNRYDDEIFSPERKSVDAKSG